MTKKEAIEDLAIERRLHHETHDKLDKAQAEAADRSARLLKIASLCNGYHNGPDDTDGAEARRVLKRVAKALGQPWRATRT